LKYREQRAYNDAEHTHQRPTAIAIFNLPSNIMSGHFASSAVRGAIRVTARSGLLLTSRPHPSAITIARLHRSSVRPTLNESDKNREDMDKEYVFHKEEMLRQAKEGKGAWKQELASNSEAAIKADRGEIEIEDKHEEYVEKVKKEPPTK